MSASMQFTILFTPKSTQHGSRAHVVRRGGVPQLKFYSDKRKNAYTLGIIEEVKHLVPKEYLTGPIETMMKFYLPRPDQTEKVGKKLFAMLPIQIRTMLLEGHPHAIPLWEYGNNFGDCDNLNKGTQDALAKAGFFKNDAQIWKAGQEKYLTELHLPARIEVSITAHSP